MRTRRALPSLVVASLVTVAAPARSTPETARPSDAFADSIGVNIHLHYDDADEAYGPPWNATFEPLLVASGIRHVRDGAFTGVPATDIFFTRAHPLTAAGIRFSLIVTFPGLGSTATDLTQLDTVYTRLGGAVDDFEGMNEPPTHGSASLAMAVRTGQQALFDAVHHDAMLHGVPVVGSSVIADYALVGSLASSSDAANLHFYPGGACPVCTDDPYSHDAMDREMTVFAPVRGSSPLWFTETGYHNALDGFCGHPPASELATGKYLPRLWLEAFNRGVVRAYAYEFLDEHADPALTDIEQHFGLVRFDGTPKPAYNATRALVALFGDVGAPVAPGALDYDLTGGDADLHHTLLEKRDGRFYLALWLEKNSFARGVLPAGACDATMRHDVVVPAQGVTVRVHTAVDHAVLHTFMDDGTMHTAPLALAGGSAVVSIADRVTVIELVPASTASDAGVARDAGEASDAGAARDASGPSDASTARDASAVSDAYGASDAAGGGDAGTPHGAGGCGCRATNSDNRATGAAALLLALAALATRRRRRAT